MLVAIDMFTAMSVDFLYRTRMGRWPLTAHSWVPCCMSLSTRASCGCCLIPTNRMWAVETPSTTGYIEVFVPNLNIWSLSSLMVTWIPSVVWGKFYKTFIYMYNVQHLHFNNHRNFFTPREYCVNWTIYNHFIIYSICLQGIQALLRW